MDKFNVLLVAMLPVLSMCMAKCPPRELTVKLDLDKFSGEWFVVSGKPPEGHSLSKCGRVFVNRSSSERFTMNYTALSYRQNKPVTFIVNARLDDDVTGNWKLQGINKSFGSYKHRVIDIDYDSHTVMIACGGDGRDVPFREFSMIWAREKTLPSTLLDNLKDKAGCYVARNRILDVDQRNC